MNSSCLWKPVNSFENLYAVSNNGHIRTIKRKGSWVNKILKPSVYKRTGYLYVNLYKNGKAKKVKVHRIVALAFLENPLNLPEVNHKDGDKKNNTSSNLEWSSRKDNALHMCYELGKTVVPIILIYHTGEVKKFKSIREASRQVGIDAGTMSAISKMKTKKDYGFIIKRAA